MFSGFLNVIPGRDDRCNILFGGDAADFWSIADILLPEANILNPGISTAPGESSEPTDATVERRCAAVARQDELDYLVRVANSNVSSRRAE